MSIAAITVKELAITHIRQRKFTEADQLLQSVLVECQELGEGHLLVFYSLFDLGTSYALQERWSEAEKVLAKGYDGHKDFYGEQNSITRGFS